MESEVDWDTGLTPRETIANLKTERDAARAELDAIAIALEWPRQDESTTLLEEVKEAACNGVLLAEAKSELHHVRNQRDNRAYVGCGLAEKLETARAEVERLRAEVEQVKGFVKGFVRCEPSELQLRMAVLGLNVGSKEGE